MEAKIPTLLKEQGFEISQFNKITQETKKQKKKTKIYLTHSLEIKNNGRKKWQLY